MFPSRLFNYIFASIFVKWRVTADGTGRIMCNEIKNMYKQHLKIVHQSQIASLIFVTHEWMRLKTEGICELIVFEFQIFNMGLS